MHEACRPDSHEPGRSSENQNDGDLVNGLVVAWEAVAGDFNASGCRSPSENFEVRRGAVLAKRLPSFKDQLQSIHGFLRKIVSSKLLKLMARHESEVVDL